METFLVTYKLTCMRFRCIHQTFVQTMQFRSFSTDATCSFLIVILLAKKLVRKLFHVSYFKCRCLYTLIYANICISVGSWNVAVLLPGFGINWKQNKITRQPQFRDLTHIVIGIVECMNVGGIVVSDMANLTGNQASENHICPETYAVNS